MEVRVGSLAPHVPIFGLHVPPNNFLMCWLISPQICQMSENKPLEKRDLNSRTKRKIAAWARILIGSREFAEERALTNHRKKVNQVLVVLDH